MRLFIIFFKCQWSRSYTCNSVFASLYSCMLQVRGTVRSTKNEEKVAPLKQLCPAAKHALELVEADLCKEEGWVEAVKGKCLIVDI